METESVRMTRNEKRHSECQRRICTHNEEVGKMSSKAIAKDLLLC